MSRLALSSAILVATATAAFAGPVVVPPAPPPVIVEPERCAQAFDCFYVGLEFGHIQPNFDELDGLTIGAGDLGLENGNVYGIFGGYNFQNGNFVYGVEARYLHVNGTISISDAEFESILDLRGRIGYAFNDALMVYSAAGYSMVEATNGVVDIDLDGFNLGLGVEYNVTDSIFVGADYTTRDLEGETAIFNYEGTANTATLRVGFRF